MASKPLRPSRDPFISGLLVGFSPLIFLAVVAFIACVGAVLFDRDPRVKGDGPSAPSLPAIDPSTPAAGLLPAPPKADTARVYVGDDLACVPELMLEDAPELPGSEWRKRKALTSAAALHLNGKEEDGYVKAVLASRPDLAGLPFAMGAACRTNGDRARAFKEAAESVSSHKAAALLESRGEAERRGSDLAHLAVAAQVLPAEDLVPRLLAMLDAPDPRAPRAEVVAGRQEAAAQELVRVNHLRNCLLCHAPAERGKTPDETLVAEVPIPTESLPDSSEGYGRSESTLLVRIDVTYLRQDFSAMQEVSDWSAKAWPDRQRFDFLVRRRVLTPAEAADLRARLAGTSPYRRAAARALRELTGRDFDAALKAARAASARLPHGLRWPR
jgi:hypothetical protein